MVLSDDDMERTSRGGERRKILVVTVRDRLSDELRDHSVHLAERLRCDLLVLSVGPPWSQELFARRTEGARCELHHQAASIGVRCEYIVRIGDPGHALEEVTTQVKRIALVVTDPEVDRSGILGDLTIPVFTVSPKTRETKGDRIMSASTARHGNLFARTAA